MSRMADFLSVSKSDLAAVSGALVQQNFWCVCGRWFGPLIFAHTERNDGMKCDGLILARRKGL